MLQIHGIFNLVATLYKTRLLQPEISICVVRRQRDIYVHRKFEILSFDTPLKLTHLLNKQIDFFDKDMSIALYNYPTTVL